MPRLSLCLMVRDEAVSLARAIGSFEGLADEIVVVDTGSKDGTVELARSLGAKVHDMPWPDDFGAVRNALFARAEGEWIFHLDADEALLPESREELAELLERQDLQAAYVVRQDLYDSDREDRFTEMWQLRLLRREGLSRQVGRCHPEFDPPLHVVAERAGRKLTFSEVRLRHWGYVSERRIEKLWRGARLLRLELAERPDQLYHRAELARTLVELDDPGAVSALSEMAELLARYRREPQPPNAGALVAIEALLALPEGLMPGGWREAALADLSARWYPRSPPLQWHLARRAYGRGEIGEALRRLETIREWAEAGGYDRTLSFDPLIVGDELWLNLGVGRMQVGDRAGAAAALARIEPESPFADAARENLAVLAAEFNGRNTGSQVE